MSSDLVARLDALTEAIDAMHVRYAEALRDAVADFNAAPISVSAVDVFRARVLAIADVVAAPMPVGDGVLEVAPGVFMASGCSVRVPERLHVVPKDAA